MSTQTIHQKLRAGMSRVLLLTVCVLTLACSGSPGDGVYGAASVGKPHDCGLIVDEQHAELVQQAVDHWLGACFDVSVIVGEPERRGSHQVVFLDYYDGAGPGNSGGVEIYDGEARRNDISVLRVLVHELGHHYGLYHKDAGDDAQSIMQRHEADSPDFPSVHDLKKMHALCEAR